ncbi:MAG: type II toxin-antitoxin system RelE/ParE family toxin [Clostridia bacterium]|nr:type II toxin-antitoxin system RelE/ParE family toxin [Clostridia bacterium]
MIWHVKFCPEADKDFKKLDNSLRRQVMAGIRKVRLNPLSQNEGGYRKPLGNIDGTEFTGFFKIKYRGIGIKVVYTVVKDQYVMNIIVNMKLRFASFHINVGRLRLCKAMWLSATSLNNTLQTILLVR